jgi:hypothetical protein
MVQYIGQKKAMLGVDEALVQEIIKADIYE